MSQCVEQQRRDRLPLWFSDVNSQHQMGGNHVTHAKLEEKLEGKKCLIRHRSTVSMMLWVIGQTIEDHKVKGHCSNL